MSLVKELRLMTTPGNPNYGLLCAAANELEYLQMQSQEDADLIEKLGPALLKSSPELGNDGKPIDAHLYIKAIIAYRAWRT